MIDVINRKIIAMLVVPIILVMSGSLAFSAFTGNAVTNVSSTAGDISFSQSAELSGAYVQNTNVTVTGGLTPSNTVSYTITSANLRSIEGSGPALATVPYNTYSLHVVYYLNVSNLAPGDWVEVHFTILNGGSVGFIAQSASINPSSVGFFPSTSPPDLNLTNLSGAPSLFSSGLFAIGEPLYGLSAGTLLADNYGATIGGQGLSGYAVAITTSGFDTSLDHNSEADYTVYIGLSEGAGNGYQESSISVPIVVSLMSDP